MATTFAEFKNEFECGKHDSEYAAYIVEHCGGDRVICNGDSLIVAMEEQYLADDFEESVRKNYKE